MLFRRYISEGLAHYSYLIGDEGRATVIDPRRDIDVYLEDAGRGGYHIDCVLETHRNEDYLIGSRELERATGAENFHADSQWNYHYGMEVQDGQEWQVGRLMLKAIHTPGHTPGSMSYILHDPDGAPWIVFTGDALFSGDAGRVDLLGEDRLEEMAGMLYDSIFEKILPLGDGVILCPAHGSGSVCGGEIAERLWTTIGLERQLNPKLQVDTKAEFIDKHAEMLERPPYFRKMEELNLKGPDVLQALPELRPLQPNAFAEIARSGQIVDTREQVCFGAAHLPGSLSIWKGNLPSFAGWYLDYETPIAFVCDKKDRDSIVRMMVRIGFDRISGYLDGGLIAWAKSGKRLNSISTPDQKEFQEMLEGDPAPFVLDVRSKSEIKDEGLRMGKRIHLTQILENLSEIPRDRFVVSVCTSGYRSMLAASLLEKEGWKNLAVPVGGLAGWKAKDFNFEL
ncbi:MAG: MBL fold metallo-hydrolase [Brevefilum sp.]